MAIEWKPIDTAPKVPGKLVLLYEGGEFTLGYWTIFNGGGWRTYDNGNYELSPTHWSELNKPEGD